MPHPEVERADQFEKRGGGGLHPVYSSTEKLTSRGFAQFWSGEVD